jgi:hypothetical protein
MSRILIVLSLLGAGAAFGGDEAEKDYDQYVRLTAKPTDSAAAPADLFPARFTQVAGGLLLSSALAVGGFAIGVTICQANPPPQFLACLAPPESGIGLFVGAMAGAYLGVRLTGLLFGRHADDGEVILGSLLGGLAALVGGVVGGVATGTPYPLVVFAVTFPTIGAAIAFERSQAAPPLPSARRLEIGVGGMPVRGGAGFSLSAAF